MDNDLMARRLRPPYEPTPANDQSLSQPSPWDVQLTDDGSFAPNAATPPQQDPPFAPPDTATRADVPWDRPAPEAWPPAEDSGTDYSQAWSAQPAPPAPEPVLPAWPAIDPLGDAAPWDTPASALDERHVEIARFDGAQHAHRRGRGLDVAAFALQQQAQGLQHVRLIVGDEDAGTLQDIGRGRLRPRRFGGHQLSTSHPSRNRMIRLPKAAFASECVTCRIVVPS